MAMRQFNKNILAIDTALGASSVGVAVSGGSDSHENIKKMNRGQAEALIPQVDAIVDGAGIAMSDLDYIVTTRGPGAFAGLRIGLSSARSYGLALSVPVIGLVTCDVIARQYLEKQSLSETQSLLVLIETKRKDFYYCVYNHKGENIHGPAAASAAGIEAIFTADQTVIAIGDAIERFEKTAKDSQFQYMSGFDLPSPKMMLGIAQLIIDEQLTAAYPPDPLYLRDADVSISKKEVRTLEGYKG